MKTIIIAALACTITINSQAQLFKKLKEKAGKVLDSKSSGSSTDAGSNKSENSDKQEDKKQPSSPPENGAVVFTLEPAEALMYDESKVLAKNGKLNYFFVVKNNRYEYFLVEDGKRTGPFKAPPLPSLQDAQGDNESENSTKPALGNDKDPVAIKYTKTINGKLHIVFNGKNYGPYDHVAKMITSPDGKQFFALVTIGGQNNMTAQMGMGNNFIVNEGAVKQKVGNSLVAVPVKFSVSEGFKHAMAAVMDQQAQEILTVSTTGKEEKGNIADMYSSGNKSFVTDDGDIVTIPSQSPTQVLVNGAEAASFSVPITSINRLFLTPDISKSVYYEKGKIYRANGTEEKLSGVLFPRVVTIGNETSVYYFKLYQTESGSKDVYLCKKVI